MHGASFSFDCPVLNVTIVTVLRHMFILWDSSIIVVHVAMVAESELL